ncbi:hypothetical protein [Rhodococcus sp. NPDC058514]
MGGPLALVEDGTGNPVRVEVRSNAGRELELEDLRVRPGERFRRQRP